MASKANQHFVPQFYFRYFSSDKRSISLILKDSKKFVAVASIKDQASRNKFYGEADLENEIGKLEAVFSGVLGKLVTCQSIDELTNEEVYSVLAATLFQRQRTLSARINARPMYDTLLKMQLENVIQTDDSLTEEERADFLSRLGTVSIDPQKPHLIQMNAALLEADLVSDLYMALLENKTSRPFIFGDAPVVFHNTFYEKRTKIGVLGYKTKGLQIVYPISPRRAIFFFDGDTYKSRKNIRGHKIKVDLLKDVEILNRLQLHESENSIYFSDKMYEVYVRYLLNKEHSEFQSRAAVVVREVAGPLIDGVPEERITTYTPLIPVKVRLSFMEQTKDDDGQQAIQYRDE